MTGDFNCSPQNPDLLAWQRSTGLRLASDPALATHRRGLVLDMIFASAHVRGGEGESDNWVAAVRESPWLSDHHLVCVRTARADS